MMEVTARALCEIEEETIKEMSSVVS